MIVDATAKRDASRVAARREALGQAVAVVGVTLARRTAEAVQICRPGHLFGPSAPR
jgi:hypothetical protein